MQPGVTKSIALPHCKWTPSNLMKLATILSLALQEWFQNRAKQAYEKLATGTALESPQRPLPTVLSQNTRSLNLRYAFDKGLTHPTHPDLAKQNLCEQDRHKGMRTQLVTTSNHFPIRSKLTGGEVTSFQHRPTVSKLSH